MSTQTQTPQLNTVDNEAGQLLLQFLKDCRRLSIQLPLHLSTELMSCFVNQDSNSISSRKPCQLFPMTTEQKHRALELHHKRRYLLEESRKKQKF